MLRVAVPNKGSLHAKAVAMLHEAGYLQRTDSKELVVTDEANNIEFFYLRPRDIATYVGSGKLDMGITGRDLLIDSAGPAEEVLALGFARSTFHFAGDPDSARGVHDLHGKVIATSYPSVVAKHLADHGVDPAGIVRLDGAVETALRLGVADVIADVVETGATLAHLGLRIIGEPIMRSEAVVIQDRSDTKTEASTRFLRRLGGVLVARDYVLLDYDIEANNLEAAVAIASGKEGPTISPLHREGWAAVRVMVPTAEAHSIMDQLEQVGARAILVTQIRACRA
ncbi:ATP phosphoribosyltransferase [Nocardiopsis dassonvillei subsp. albirubida]|uniref:ATP phosphoribosyltransferase n=2 Tax=Nocardiopsidaceae TaxID=83676 RepID=A0A7X6MBJ0_9ACTN|nr:ATP phosphoribosyltransferase [Nocardiopsis alborubida]